MDHYSELNISRIPAAARAETWKTRGTLVASGVAGIAALALASIVLFDGPGVEPAEAEQPAIAQSVPAPSPAESVVTTAKADRPVVAVEITDPGASQPMPLSTDDPRWSAAPAAPAPTDDQDAALAAQLTEQAVTEQPSVSAATANEAAPLDPETTASIDPQASGIDVQVAETEEEIAALESAAAAAETGATTGAGIAPAFASNAILKSATVSEHVNLRAEPTNDGEVLAIVPANGAVEAAEECPHFCEATYQGQRGFIYKNYLRFETPAVAATAPTEQPAQ